MMLGFILVGTVLGAAAAGGLLWAGSSLFLAFVVYSLVGTIVTLGAALLSFALSHPTKNDEIPFAGVFQPGEYGGVSPALPNGSSRRYEASGAHLVAVRSGPVRDAP